MMRRRLFALLPALLLLVGAAGAQIVGSLPFNLQNNTTADASQVMANFNAIVNGTNANSAKNGVNNDITQLSALSTPLTRAQGGAQTHIATATATGSVNSQIVVATSPTYVLDAGDVVQFVPAGTNTGAATLNVAGTGALDIYRLTSAGLVPLVGGEIVSGSTARALYDGTRYQLLTDATAGVPPATVIYTAATTADPGYLLLQGQAISRTTYAAVFARIGDSYGTGDGVTTFNLPDARGRTIFSVDGGANRISTCGSSGALGSACGSQSTTLVQGNLPNYSIGTFLTGASLDITAVGASGPGGLSVVSSNLTILTSSAAASIGGSSTAFSNLPPAIVLNAMMKY